MSMDASKLNALSHELALPFVLLTPAWIKATLPRHWASPIALLAELLGTVEWDVEHQVMHLRRTDLNKLVAGELFGIEIGIRRLGAPTLYCEYVHLITANGGEFRGKLRPLTLKGLRRAIRASEVRRNRLL